MMDPLYNEDIIPTLYAKIGALSVRCDVLASQNEQLRAELVKMQGELEDKDLPIRGEV